MPELAVTDAYRAAVYLHKLGIMKQKDRKWRIDSIGVYLRAEQTEAELSGSWGPNPTISVKPWTTEFLATWALASAYKTDATYDLIIDGLQVMALFRLCGGLYECGGGAVLEAVGIIEDTIRTYGVENHGKVAFENLAKLCMWGKGGCLDGKDLSLPINRDSPVAESRGRMVHPVFEDLSFSKATVIANSAFYRLSEEDLQSLETSLPTYLQDRGGQVVYDISPATNEPRSVKIRAAKEIKGNQTIFSLPAHSLHVTNSDIAEARQYQSSSGRKFYFCDTCGVACSISQAFDTTWDTNRVPEESITSTDIIEASSSDSVPIAAGDGPLAGANILDQDSGGSGVETETRGSSSDPNLARHKSGQAVSEVEATRDKEHTRLPSPNLDISPDLDTVSAVKGQMPKKLKLTEVDPNVSTVLHGQVEREELLPSISTNDPFQRTIIPGDQLAFMPPKRSAGFQFCMSSHRAPFCSDICKNASVMCAKASMCDSGLESLIMEQSLTPRFDHALPPLEETLPMNGFHPCTKRSLFSHPIAQCIWSRLFTRLVTEACQTGVKPRVLMAGLANARSPQAEKANLTQDDPLIWSFTANVISPIQQIGMICWAYGANQFDHLNALDGADINMLLYRIRNATRFTRGPRSVKLFDDDGGLVKHYTRSEWIVEHGSLDELDYDTWVGSLDPALWLVQEADEAKGQSPNVEIVERDGQTEVVSLKGGVREGELLLREKQAGYGHRSVFVEGIDEGREKEKPVKKAQSVIPDNQSDKMDVDQGETAAHAA